MTHLMNAKKQIYNYLHNDIRAGVAITRGHAARLIYPLIEQEIDRFRIDDVIAELPSKPEAVQDDWER